MKNLLNLMKKLIEGFIFIWKQNKNFLFVLVSVTISTIYNHLATKSYETSISIRSNSSNSIELQNLHNSLGYDIRVTVKSSKKDNFNLLNDYFWKICSNSRLWWTSVFVKKK